MAEVPLMPERDFPYGNRGYPRECTTYGSGGVGFDRLRPRRSRPALFAAGSPA